MLPAAHQAISADDKRFRGTRNKFCFTQMSLIKSHSRPQYTLPLCRQPVWVSSSNWFYFEKKLLICILRLLIYLLWMYHPFLFYCLVNEWIEKRNTKNAVWCCQILTCSNRWCDSLKHLSASLFGSSSWCFCSLLIPFNWEFSSLFCQINTCNQFWCLWCWLPLQC